MSEQTDTIEAVALAVRATCGLSDRESADIAQAAIASHTKALIEQAGEVDRRLLDHAHMIQRDGLGAMLDTAAQAAATIAALREELRQTANVKDDHWRNVRRLARECTERDKAIAALRAEIERAKEQGVRAGIEAAAGAALNCALYDSNEQLLNSDPRATCSQAARALDAAAIAKGV